MYYVCKLQGNLFDGGLKIELEETRENLKGKNMLVRTALGKKMGCNKKNIC